MRISPTIQAVLAHILLLFTSCTQNKNAEEPTVPVTVSKAILEDVPLYLKGIGVLKPSISVDMRPQIDGVLTEVLFEAGQYVDKHTLLMTLDSRLYEADLEIAKANLGTEEAAYRLYHDITKRMEKLVQEDFVSEVEYEKSLEKLEASHANIEKTYGEIKKAEVNLGYTSIYSPIAGYLGDKNFDAGNYVSSSQKKPLVTIHQVTPLDVEFSLPSYHLEEIRKKQEEAPLFLKAERPSDTTHPLVGELEFIDNTVNPKTGMIKLKGTIPNIDERGWPGEFVRVYLLLETIKNAVIVPTASIIMGQDADFIYVLDEKTMRVEMRMVKKGIALDRKTLIEWGIKEGEIVITDGQLNLTPNTKVTIEET